MATKLGLHITPGSRNGYGPVAEAAPAVVLSIGDSAPLREAWEKGGRRTITIYRDMKVYEHGNAPPGFPQMTEEQARAAADDFWPQLRAEYEANPADYYQPTNEIAGGLNDPEGSDAFKEAMRSVRNLIVYETRLMELSEAEGGRFKLAIASLSGGTPGSFELWKELFVPLIRRAGEGGHIYSRHAYGPGLLTAPGPAPTDGNAGRPFKEAAYLRQQGIHTPMVITEAGPNAGYKFPGVGEFMADVKRYDQLCQQHDNIWGFCCWTYGNWRDGKPNIEKASDQLAAYLRQQGGAVRPQYPSPAVTAPAPQSDEPGAAEDVVEPAPEPAAGTGASATTTVAPEPAVEGRDMRFVTAEAGLNLRRGPSIADEVIRPLKFRTMVEVLEEGTWARVRAGGDIGFVSSQFLSAPAPPVRERERPEPEPERPEPEPEQPQPEPERPEPQPERPQPEPEPERPEEPERYRYQGRRVDFFTGIHGPASDHVWQNKAFVRMMQRLDMPILFMSNGINVNFANAGKPGRDIVRLYYSFNPEKTDPGAVYQEIREDQLRPWWNKNQRRFIFFNEVNLPPGHGQSHEGRGTHWDTPDEFARFLGICLKRAREDFPGIQLYTTPMTPSFDPWAWRKAMWDTVKDLVSGYAMHAYSGNNSDANAAAKEIADQAVTLQQRLRLQVPLAITEASVNRGNNAAQKARVAHLLPKHLAHIPGIEGVFWFAADWDDAFDVNNEGWFRKGIADAYLQQRV